LKCQVLKTNYDVIATLKAKSGLQRPTVTIRDIAASGVTENNGVDLLHISPGIQILAMSMGLSWL
jgi:hypothetical protein